MEESLIEVVANISEGRDKDTIYCLEDVLRSYKSVYHLHTDIGESTNRSVITYAAIPAVVKEVTFEFVRMATSLIDMEKQQGAHPRIGAVDVVPFIPLCNCSMEEAIQTAKEVAKRVGRELQIPVYLYANNATSAERKRLPFIRKGEYEGLEKRMREGFTPDYGPTIFNKKSGATVMGARNIMVAYNINLNSDNVDVAKKIAAICRSQKSLLNGKTVGGTFEGLQAKGWYIDQYKCAQVTCNIHDTNSTSLHGLYNQVKTLAKDYGINLNGSELIGLVPKEYLLKSGYFFAHNKEIEPNITLSAKLSKTDQQTLIEVAIEELGLKSVRPFNPDLQIIESVLML